MTAGRSHTHTWNAATTNVADARDFVALRLAEHGLDSAVPDARLVVSELATNAVRHAGTRFTLTLLIQDGSVLLTVTDPSSTWPALAVDPPFAADMSPADGVGVVDGVGWSTACRAVGVHGRRRVPGGGRARPGHRRRTVVELGCDSGTSRGKVRLGGDHHACSPGRAWPRG